MPSQVTLVVVLGLLGFSMGLPVEESVPYNPQDFYSLPYILDTSNAPQKPAANLNTLPYNPQEFYSSPVRLDNVNSENSGRLVGGTEAKEGAAPYMTALVVGYLIPSFMCGGSVVTPSIVVTSAHCIDPMVSWVDGKLMESARGQVGSNSLSEGYSVVRFAGYENHPDWDQWLIKNDIGVLRLVEKLTWSESVQPLKLSYDWISGGQLVQVTGWGRLSVWGALPDRLQELSVHVLSPEQCEDGIRQANEQLRISPPVHPEIELCTLHKRGEGFGFCNGDSGSPLIYKGQQVAIVSWGRPCAVGYPDVSARISGFRDWLTRVLRE